MKRSKVDKLTGVRGVRTEGTLLKEPVARVKPKSQFLLDLEAKQRIAPTVERSAVLISDWAKRHEKD